MSPYPQADHPTPLAKNPKWYTALIEVQRHVDMGKAIPWAIRRVMSEQHLGEDFLAWARKGYGLSMRGVSKS